MDRNDSEEKILDCIIKLNVAVRNARLYPPDNRSVIDAVEAAYGAITGILSLQRQLSLIVVGDDLVANSLRLQTVSGLGQFVDILKGRAIDNLTFLRGVRRSDLQNLIRALASHEAAPVRGGTSIRLGRIEGVDRPAEQGADIPEIEAASYEIGADRKALTELHASMQDKVKEIYDRVRERQQVEVMALDKVISSFVYGPFRMINPLQLLADVKSHDEYTYVHMVNVCTLTMSQAESLGFKGAALRQIGLAAALHDVGKLFVPDEIINKPGKLNREERAIMETHPLRGVRHLIRLSEIPKLAVVCALEHHMRWDGKGYPPVEEGWQPHIVSQMISIADVFDAMRSKRPYSEPHPQGIIVETLKQGRGTAFNPFLVDNFLDIISLFY